MVFTAEQMQKPERIQKQKRAEYPFASMKATPNTGFVIPAERADLFQHCRVMASLYNQKHGTAIRCNKQADGSMRVWNESTAEQPADNTAEILEQSIAAVEAKKADSQAPNKEQYTQYLQTLTVGMSITLDKEYAHRFVEFVEWTAELPGYVTETKFNPPTLKITRKGA